MKDVIVRDPSKLQDLLPLIPNTLLNDPEFPQIFHSILHDISSKFRSELRGKNILEGTHLPFMHQFFQICNNPIILKSFADLLLSEGLNVIFPP